MKQSYITTAIPYVNGNPHLGHAMDYLLADTLRRYMLSQGLDVRLQVGTDEHGNKIYKKAQENGLSAYEFATQNSNKFREFIDSLGVKYDYFVRTTDEDHVRRCRAIWEALSDHIYKGAYEGWYCEGCECYISDDECEKNSHVCPDHQKPYERIREENYFLRVSDFKDRIREAIEKDELKITPSFRKKEFLNLLADMPDVSISRPKAKVPWGVSVPGDEDQVMYVWIDALSNYITVLGYPEKDISKSWPAHTQIVGKDILRFHAGIWPCILLGLGLELPKNLLAHGFITVNGTKMSKSLGNVISPDEIIAKHGLDPFRYYFLRHASTVDDADFTWEKYEAAYCELANDLGNLVQRLATLCKKNDLSGLEIPTVTFGSDFRGRMDDYEFNFAFDIAWAHVQEINRRIDAEKPWALAKTDPEQAKLVLGDLVAELLRVTEELKIFIPDTAEKIDRIFTAEKILPPETPLFPRA